MSFDFLFRELYRHSKFARQEQMGEGDVFSIHVQREVENPLPSCMKWATVT